MSICSVLPGLSLGMGDLRPFSPLAGFFRCYVTLLHFCPRFLPGSANSLRFSAPAREVSGFVRIKKNKKILSPPPRRATVRAAGTKSSHSCRKSRYAMHNGFFVISLETLSRILLVADSSSPNIVQSLPASSPGFVSAQSAAPLCFPRPVPL